MISTRGPGNSKIPLSHDTARKLTTAIGNWTLGLKPTLENPFMPYETLAYPGTIRGGHSVFLVDAYNLKTFSNKESLSIFLGNMELIASTSRN